MQIWFLYIIFLVLGIILYKILNFKEKLTIGGEWFVFYKITPSRRTGIFRRKIPAQISNGQVTNINDANIDDFNWDNHITAQLDPNQFLIGIYGPDIAIFNNGDEHQREQLIADIDNILENNLNLRQNTLINYQDTNIDELTYQFHMNLLCAANNV